MNIKVKELIAEQLGIDESQVTNEARIDEDLGADSLDMVELIMSIEEEFNIDIIDEDIEKCRTVGDIIKYLETKGL